MNIEDCPDCPGLDCPAYQEQAQRRPTLGLRAYVDAGVDKPESQKREWARNMLHRQFVDSGRVLDADAFHMHVLPVDGGTEYAVLLANRALTGFGER